jgi:MYXO-CTERM domain-containing protein
MSLGKFTSLCSAVCVLGLSTVASAATVAQWNFDSYSISDTNVIVPDDSGHGHIITLPSSNSSLSTTTPYAPATTGDKSLLLSNYNTSGNLPANITDPGGIDLTKHNAFTIQGWLYPSYNPGNKASGTLLALDDVAPGNNQNSLNLLIAGNGKVQFRLSYAGVGLNVYSADLLPASEWTFVAVTYDGTTLTLYTGSPGSSALTVSSDHNKPGSITDAGTLLTFGYGQLGTTYANQSNTFDDVRISDVALSQTDIAASMKSFTQVPEPEPGAVALLGLGGLLTIRRRRNA